MSYSNTTVRTVLFKLYRCVLWILVAVHERPRTRTSPVCIAVIDCQHSHAGEVVTVRGTSWSHRAGADSMEPWGRWGRSPPRPKSCGGDALKSPHRNFVMSDFWNGKMYIKNKNYHYASDKSCADFSLKMHRKRLAAGLRPDPLGGAYSAPSPTAPDLAGKKG